MTLESRLAKINWPSRKRVVSELTSWEFWRASIWSLLWSMAGAVVVFLGSHVLHWETGTHELVWLIALPIPMTFLISLLAGWWHQSRRIMWTVAVIGGTTSLCWIPLAVMGLIMALGFQSVR
ncbi:MAG: hypothetical protein HUJ26_19675 [Planctomycetaceae bacterium]|nr:hypothetical protein [Planctomycetaceae bacterium]